MIQVLEPILEMYSHGRVGEPSSADFR
jgi:hypothetical protein